MSEQPREPKQYDPDHDHGDEQDGDRPLIPDTDAGQPEAAKYSRDEQGHGRQDYGP